MSDCDPRKDLRGLVVDRISFVVAEHLRCQLCGHYEKPHDSAFWPLFCPFCPESEEIEGLIASK